MSLPFDYVVRADGTVRQLYGPECTPTPGCADCSRHGYKCWYCREKQSREELTGAPAPAPAPAAPPPPPPSPYAAVLETPWTTVPSLTAPPPPQTSGAWNKVYYSSIKRWRSHVMPGPMKMLYIEAEAYSNNISRHIIPIKSIKKIVGREWNDGGIRPTGSYRPIDVVVEVYREGTWPEHIKFSFCEAVNAVAFQHSLMTAFV